MRVHELSKELGLSSKELLEKLQAAGIEAKNHMSALDDAAVQRMRALKAPAATATAAPAPAEAKPHPPKAEAAKPAAPKPQAAKPPPPKAPAAAHPPAPKVVAPAAKPEAPRPPVSPKVAPPPAAPPKKAVSAPAPVPVAAKPETPEPVAPAAAPAEPASKVLTLRGAVVVKELAEHLGLRPNQLIAEMMAMNVLASINERIDFKVAQKIAEKHGFVVEHEKKPEHKPVGKTLEQGEEEAEGRPEDLAQRPPVVTVLGHVDHGKTSLLDKIRHTSVAKGEFGGITQHIGASTVEHRGQQITFLDTPGHEAFTSMRARGANLTDIAVIVIAADDGVMPQTVEAIKHAQAAEVPILVAINKVDLPAANVDRVKQQLAGMNLTPEDWGGTVICCAVSAHTGKGINELLEMILLQSEMLELKANPKIRGRGYVIEAQLEPGMGPTANLLVTDGTLNVGDIVLCGPHWGRIRALINDHGVKVRSAAPATPVKCLGLAGVPGAGTEFRACVSDRHAREQAEARQAQMKAEQLSVPKRASLDTLYQKMKDNEERLELRLILKTDVHGSLEAIGQSLREIKSDKVSVNILLAAVGNVTPNDVLLAKASDAVILGFHVAKEEGVVATAKREGVEIRLHSIIYELLDQVREAMTGMLSPIIRERVTGHAEILQLFTVSKGAAVAGCMVKDGKIGSRANARVQRQGDVIYEGSIVSLRRFQNDASEVTQGQECGIRLDNFTDFAPGDIIEAYESEKIAQQL